MATLAQKLGLRPAMRICLLDAPADAVALIRAAAPGGCTFATEPGGPPFDLIFCWPDVLAGLAERFAALERHIVPDGAIWAVLPKMPIARRRGITLTWKQMQAAALTTDLVDNKIASLGDDEYGTRFVIRRDRRPGIAQV